MKVGLVSFPLVFTLSAESGHTYWCIIKYLSHLRFTFKMSLARNIMTTAQDLGQQINLCTSFFQPTNPRKGHNNHVVIVHTASWLCNWRISDPDKQCPNEVIWKRENVNIYLLSACQINGTTMYTKKHAEWNENILGLMCRCAGCNIKEIYRAKTNKWEPTQTQCGFLGSLIPLDLVK